MLKSIENNVFCPTKMRKQLLKLNYSKKNNLKLKQSFLKEIVLD